MTIENKRRGWKGTSSLVSWTRTLTVEAEASAPRPVDEIGVDEIKRVVAPIWEAGLKMEGRPRVGRAHRPLGYRSARHPATVFDVARAHDWRSADNPAAWTVFKHILPEGPKGEKSTTVDRLARRPGHNVPPAREREHERTGART